METLWFWIVALMLTAYVVLDGYDLGAGIVHLGVARNDAERRSVLASIGPYWDANEVWLLAAGGTLYFAFPALYAASFSGFYLPLTMVLWLLILRGIAIEFRHHLEHPLWQPVWDTVFCGASALLAIFFGAALGNVIRGVPFDADGQFFLALWTDFGVTGDVGILDWYTVSVGLLAFLTLAHHGSLWVAYKTTGAVRKRSHNVASYAFLGIALLTAIVTWMTWNIQPLVPSNLAAYPVGWIFPLAAIAGLGAAWWYRRTENDLLAFMGSSAYIVGMLASAAFGVYPYVLPSSSGAGLTAMQAAAPEYGLRIGLTWFLPGMLLALGYFTYVFRHFRGRVE